MLRALLMVLLGASTGEAHTLGPIGPGQVWQAWRIDPWLTACLALFAVAYARGAMRLWRRAGPGRGVQRRGAFAYAGGMLVLAGALLSPLEAVTFTLLAAHMVQHVLLIAVAPPLLLIGRPDAVFAFALPAPMRQGISRKAWLRRPLRGLRQLARPLPAAALHGAAVWVWHAPAPFQAALDNPALHHLEHASFFLTALLFWQALLVSSRSPAASIAGILATVATLIQGGFLGALITLTGRPLYPIYGGAGLWGLSALEDQQLAGLMMWVPTGAIYLVAGLWLAARLIGGDVPAARVSD